MQCLGLFEGLSGWGTWRLADGGQGHCETLQCPTRNPQALASTLRG